MWFTLAVLLLLLVTAAVLNLVVRIDIEFEARMAIEVNSRQTIYTSPSVLDLDELQ